MSLDNFFKPKPLSQTLAMEQFEQSPKLKAQIKRYESRFFRCFVFAHCVGVVILVAAKFELVWITSIGIAAFILCVLYSFLIAIPVAFRSLLEWLTGPDPE